MVGSVAGSNNTYYRSETTLINNRSIPQTVEMFRLERVARNFG